MSNRFEYDQQTFEEWEASLHVLGLSPLAFAKLKGVAARRVQEWKARDGVVPVWATLLTIAHRFPEARDAMNAECRRRLRFDHETGETFGEATVERKRA